MRPTEFAKFQFEISARWAQQVIESNTASEDMKNVAAAVRDLAGGMIMMSTGLRATYMLLEQMKTENDRARLVR